MPLHTEVPRGLTLFVLYATTCTLMGWALSALRLLNAGTTAVVIALAACASLRRCRLRSWLCPGKLSLNRRWFRMGLPGVYFLSAVLAFAGGAHYPPSNYDALSYRLPRMLHWASQGGWHWIITPNTRMNLSATGVEWMQLPLLLAGTDRLLFLVNALAYLLLPGLIFSVARLSGVSRRVAWTFMWLLPTGYGFVLQAGSIGNDLVGVVFALAAVCYALTAGRTGKIEQLWLAALSAALLTGTKASNIPLLLPICVAAWPALPLLRQRPWATAVVTVVMVLASFAPNALANLWYTGDWTGDATNRMRLRESDPVAGLIGNGLQFVAQSIAPPLLPAARKLESAILASLPRAIGDMLKADFVRFRLCLGELPQEEVSGAGAGILLMLFVGVTFALRADERVRTLRWPLASRIGLGAWIAFLLYMVCLCSESTARLTLPYQTLMLLPLLASPSQAVLVRRRWWNGLATLCAASSLCVLVLTPARPLLPVRQVLAKLTAMNIARTQLARSQLVYETYSLRNDALARVHRHIPRGVETVGLIAGGNDMEYSLWKGIHGGRVMHLWDGQSLVNTAATFPTWCVIKADAWAQMQLGELSRWAAPRRASVVARETLVSTVARGGEEWWVVRVDK